MGKQEASELPVDVETEVLIVGGGPVGLTARALLARWGVAALLVEKRTELSPFPRSRLVNTRSMEIYRQLGLADPIAARGFAPEFGRVRFRETLYGPDFATAGMVGINAPIPESPLIGVLTSQDRLEPTLLAAADSPTRFGVELVDLAEEPESVVASLVDHQRGERIRVRAKYVLAADGANSTIRQRLGIGTTGPGALGDFTTVVFDADLARWRAGQPAGVYFTTYGSFAPLYPEGGWAWFGPTPENPADADWAALVSRALGPGADVEADVLRVQHWQMSAFVADRFRHGRILLVGDAAHAMPPIGGLGMNTGIGDAHNLCWKLAGVLRGWAGPNLLDTYETERHPADEQVLRQSVANTRLLMEVLNRRERGDSASTEVEVPWSERYFDQLGLVLGQSYRSAAVLGNGSVAPEVGTEYVPTAEPGHRMPHVWLGDNHSTLDTFGEWFTLLTADPARWKQQATTASPLHIEALPQEDAERYGLGMDGALLVRPDGHIGARWSAPHDTALHEALVEITR